MHAGLAEAMTAHSRSPRSRRRTWNNDRVTATILDGKATRDEIFVDLTARVATLREELMRRHPYAVPEFVVIAIAETSDAYGAWLLDAL